MVKKFIPLLLIISMAFKCSDNRLEIINSTGKNIVVVNHIWVADSTSYEVDKQFVDENYLAMIPANVKNQKPTYHHLPESWNDYFQHSDTLVFVIYDRNSIEHALKSKHEKYIASQTIFASKNYLEENNWRIYVQQLGNSVMIKL